MANVLLNIGKDVVLEYPETWDGTATVRWKENGEEKSTAIATWVLLYLMGGSSDAPLSGRELLQRFEKLEEQFGVLRRMAVFIQSGVETKLEALSNRVKALEDA